MPRTHSLTSLSTCASTSSAATGTPRFKNADVTRQDLSTESLISGGEAFSRKSRKHDHMSPRPSAFNFPNGEVFTPRMAPSRRARPARIPDEQSPRGAPGAPHQNFPQRPLRSKSMVSAPTAPSPSFPHIHPGPHPGPIGPPMSHQYTNLPPSHPDTRPGGAYLNRPPSFNHHRQKNKQDLVHSLRSTKMDTPTNINVQLPSPVLSSVPTLTPQHMPAQVRSFSLTNNRYAENAANIVRSESFLPSGFPDPAAVINERGARSDSAPSSISNYNLNRSNSNTPQTSVSGSEAALENTMKSWSSSESMASFRTARDPSPLSSIDESVGPEAISSENGTLHARDHYLNVSQFDPPTDSLILQARRSQYYGSSSSSPSSVESVPVFRFQGDTFDEKIDITEKSADGGSSAEPSPTIRFDEECPSEIDRVVSRGSGNSSDHSPEIPHSSVSNISSNTSIEPSGSDSDTSNAEQPDILELETQDLLPDSSAKANSLILMDSSTESKVTLHEPSHTDFLNDAPGNNGNNINQEPEHPSSVTSQVQDSVVPEKFVSKTLEYTPSGLSNSEVQTLEEDELKKPCAPSEEITKDVIEENLSPGVTKVSSSGTEREISENHVFEASDVSAIPSTEESSNLNGVQREVSDENSIVSNEEETKSEVSSVEWVPEPPNLRLSERRKSIISPSLTPSHSNPDSENSSDVPIRKGSIRASKSDSDLSELADHLSQKNEASARENSLKDEVHFVNTKHNKSLRTTADEGTLPSEVESHGAIDIQESDFYSPVQIDRFLTDDQEAVPPRGDLAVRNGSIKFNKRDASSISSGNSHQIKISPRKQNYPYSYGSRAASTETLGSAYNTTAGTPRLHSTLPGDAIEPDKQLPPPPKLDLVPKDQLDDQQSEGKSIKENDTVPTRNSSLTRNMSLRTSSSRESKPRGLKKFFKFMKFGSKNEKESEPKLRSKPSMNSLGTFDSPAVAGENKGGGLQRNNSRSSSIRRMTKSTNSNSQSEKQPGTRKREFLSNLKLTTGFKVYDLPSPAYSVRERTSSPDVNVIEPEPESPKFDLPEYDVEEDSFGDVLLKFQEVEKEIENEVRVLRKTKSIHDFFLKDDELSKAQIFDQQKKDNQSTDSLTGKFSAHNGSFVTVDSDCYAASSQETLSTRMSESIIDFPKNSDRCTIILDTAQVMAALADPYGARQSYLKYVRQFSDFKEIRLELSGFDPSQKADILEIEPRQQVSGLGKGSVGESRKVKFSNSIAISETYAPSLYKRNNKSVTQYYLSEYSEINRIKNELNAYKCYEMLVHEKSQTNTHFFY
ncbi:hypothetical protein JCM33374_g2399 [Metschnikowia sp. JCM 33374]|nr:hypothetical protein JCM33374_g2399 [Metschnikowia sp. JCM 33374]